ncbi:MAG TPA: hypothetical protein VER03_01825, partial [Bryobacteraceae bacterium]|nr:hypothetical protein [Bryobacteraceae bacterium]
VTIWLSSINRRNAQKSASTSVMYQIQEQAEKNLRGYLDGPRTVTSQRLALQNIDALIGLLKSPQGCGNPDLGDAGRRCWQERATPEGIYSWYGAFRDPIANDKPNPDPPGVIGSAVDALSSFGGQLFGETDGQPSQWPLWVAIAAAAVALSE